MLTANASAGGNSLLKNLKTRADRRTVPVTVLSAAGFDSWLEKQSPALRSWLADTGFAAKAGQVSLVAGADGGLARALAGIGDTEPLWDWAAIAEQLPAGRYRIDGRLKAAAADAVALGWAFAAYRFHRYREGSAMQADLVWPTNCDRAAVESAALATDLARDLINTPASDMGPAELAAAARRMGREFGARCRVVTGPALLRDNYPAIHAVGRASDRAPRLIDMSWSRETGGRKTGGRARVPKVTLVGKGVCFDTGGLDLKGAQGMKLMKKDMGGAATILGLARMVMAARLKVCLRVLIPAVENSVSSNAMRPLDVVPTRSGRTVEIGNTDAEGRVVLADALTTAIADKPDLIIDCATLTGAARVALGSELPAMFCNDDATAAALSKSGEKTADPLWRLPLWAPYKRHIESPVADLTNAPDEPLGGAITAALFLAEFVDPDIPWVHLDLMAWNTRSRPGRPKGGEAMGMRALFDLIANRFGT